MYMYMYIKFIPTCTCTCISQNPRIHNVKMYGSVWTTCICCTLYVHYHAHTCTHIHVQARTKRFQGPIIINKICMSSF